MITGNTSSQSLWLQSSLITVAIKNLSLISALATIFFFVLEQLTEYQFSKIYVSSLIFPVDCDHTRYLPHLLRAKQRELH